MADWNEVTLGEVTVLISRGTAPVYVDDSRIWAIGQRCIQDNAFIPSAGRPHDDSVAARLIAEPGDVLVNSTGTGTIGRSCVYDRSRGEFMVDGHVTVVRADPSQADPRILNELLRLPEGQRYLESRCYTGSTNQVELSRAELSCSPIRLPPLEEQRRIAEVLDTVDESIQVAGRVVQKLREVRNGLRLSVLDTYFPGSGPLSQRASRSVDECVLLSALLESREIELGRGKVISSNDIADDPGPHPIYSSSASAAGEFGRYGRFMFDEELITWSIDGGGRPFYRPRHRFSVTNVGGFLRIKASQRWSYQFVHALMEVQHAKLSFDWSTKAHPSVIRDLYWFPRVPLSEQHQITDRLAAADVLVQQETAQMVKLNRLRAGLAADLLSGRVRTVAT